MVMITQTSKLILAVCSKAGFKRRVRVEAIRELVKLFPAIQPLRGQHRTQVSHFFKFSPILRMKTIFRTLADLMGE